ncbi:MAG TPA: hypothetical protein DD490_06175, partial [Acidobacteria bacterium]|nr:hypothetical protein [Acidobacteriota bacterium]
MEPLARLHRASSCSPPTSGCWPPEPLPTCGSVLPSTRREEPVMSGARRCFALAVCAAALTACATTPSAPKSPKAGGPCDWSYSNQAAWPTICPQYAACGNGSRQSPINVTGALARSLPALEFAYGPRQVTVVDTGHDIQVQLPAGGSTSLTVGGRTYQLAQFHFHEPSEHTVNGQGAAMEVHFVHADQGGE